MYTPRLGEVVIYDRYGLHSGTVSRVGASTIDIKDGWTQEKLVKLRNVYEATSENLERLQKIKDLGNQIVALINPLQDQQEILKAQIRLSDKALITSSSPSTGEEGEN